jgi:predicted PurR-regulated permease PerM
MPEPDFRRVAIELPWRTIAKVLATIALVWVWLKTSELFLLVLLAVLLAVTLDPLVRRLERRGLPRWGASTVVAFALLSVVGAIVYFAATTLPGQGHMVATRMIEAERDLAQRVPEVVREAVGAGSPGEMVQSYLGPAMLRLTQAVVGSLVVVALAFILTLYLLIEGETTYRWLLAFVPARRRAKVAETAVESQRVIFGYVAGNVATSIFATIFVLVALSLLKVPAALLLALVAGIADFVPVLGFIASAVPAVVLALSVSPTVAVIVLLLYVGYHTLENYLIAPWVYGDRLRLSNVAVVLAFAVGAAIAGVIGALIALPIAAAYPAIERIWLREQVGEQTVREHREIEESDEVTK